MYLRAIVAFFALPGVVAGVVPALLVAWDKPHGEHWVIGLALLAVGLVLLLWCARDFFVSGRGTLAPWDPPKRLVIVGLYRFVRNPMYIAVLILLAGWSVATGSRVVAGYTVIVAIGFHLRVLFHEEPWLRRQFGTECAAYFAAVPRWLPRLSVWGRG